MSTPTNLLIAPIMPTSGEFSKGGPVNLSSIGVGWGQVPPDQLVSLLQNDLQKMNSQINAIYTLLNQNQNFPIFTGSGTNHQAGAVYDPGYNSQSGVYRFLREDGVFTAPDGPQYAGGQFTQSGSTTVPSGTPTVIDSWQVKGHVTDPAQFNIAIDGKTFKIPSSGPYLIACQIRLTSGVSSQIQFGCTLASGGGTLYTYTSGYQAFLMGFFAKNATFSFTVTQSSGSSDTTNTTYTWASIMKLGSYSNVGALTP